MYTKEQVEEIIRDAFNKGAIWAETYTSWVEPTPEQTEENIQSAINDIMGKN